MDIFDVKTKKDLFLLKLRDEAITFDVIGAAEQVDVGSDTWATKEHLDHLWNIGVLVRLDSGKTLVTHNLVGLVMGWDGKPELDHTPEGTVLGK